jgi:hypothetical protein
MKRFSLLSTLTILMSFSMPAIAGQWEIQQDNGFKVFLDIQQTGTVLTGTASYSYSNRTVTGYITKGSIDKNNWMEFTLNWSTGSSGKYNGHIDPGGIVRDGFTQDVNNPSSTAKWKTITPVNLGGGGTSGGSRNANPGNQYCAANCQVCKRAGLRCTSSQNCSEKYPTTAPWMCY